MAKQRVSQKELEEEGYRFGQLNIANGDSAYYAVSPDGANIEYRTKFGSLGKEESVQAAREHYIPRKQLKQCEDFLRYFLEETANESLVGLKLPVKKVHDLHLMAADLLASLKG